MSWGTILLGYSVVFGGVGLYAYSLVRRASLLASKLGLGETRRRSSDELATTLEDGDATPRL